MDAMTTATMNDAENTVKAGIDGMEIGYRFLCRDDRELLRKEGLSVQADGDVKHNEDGTCTLPNGVTAYGLSYAKVPKKIKQPKMERDSEGFFLPKPDPYRHDGKGVFCEVFGESPENVVMDMDGSLDYLAKEAYEYEIRGLLCQIRGSEDRMHRKFAHMDEVETSASAGMTKEEQSRTAATIKKIREMRLNSITWKYDWIQYYKKDCYLFAQYMIEDKWKKVNPEVILKGLSEDEKKCVLQMGEDLEMSGGRFKTHGSGKSGSKKGSGKKGKSAKAFARPGNITKTSGGTAAAPDEGEVKKLARVAEDYWTLKFREKKKTEFCQRFVKEVATMPEANRRLIDTMYETAWHLIWEYCYDLYSNQVPAPWYDTVTIGNTDISQNDAATGKHVESTEGNS